MSNTHEVTVGPRYVFFNSLPGPKALSSYKAVKATGESYLQEATNALSASEESDNTQYEQTMQLYIKMIGDLAKTARTNEIGFVQNFKKILNEDQTKQLPDKFQELASSLTTENFDYKNLIALINELLKQSNTDMSRQRQQIAANNMEAMNQRIKLAQQQFQEETNQKLKENLQEHRYNIVHKILKNLNVQEGQLKDFSRQITERLSSRFNTIMKTIYKNPSIQQTIITTWQQGWTDTTNLQKLIIGIVFEYLSQLNYNDLITKTGVQMTNEIENNIDVLASNVDFNFVDNIINLLLGSARKSLEEVALTTGRDLARMFSELTDDEQKKVIEQYGQYNKNLTVDNVKKILDANTSSALGKLSKILKSAIRTAAQKQFNEEFKDVKGKELKKQQQHIAQLMTKQSDFFKKRELKSNIQKAVDVRLDGPGMAEFIASKQVQNALRGVIFVPGKSIQLKTDISAVFSYSELNFDWMSEDLIEKLQTSMDTFQQNFLQQYKARTSNSINIPEAELAFRDIMGGVQKQVEKSVEGIEDAQKKKQEILTKLNDFVNTSISVKEYAYGGNNLTGFYGSSLGANPDVILNNISKMYELGGLSPIDIDTLYFVLINCGVDSIAHNLEQNLNDYLIGGAAMMMFDDGFASANAFIAKMIEEFGFMPKILNLFNIQGQFVPASFVYTSIYNGLLKTYNDIIQQLPQVEAKNSNSLEIQNSITENDIPDASKEDQHRAQQRFDYVAKIANTKDKVDIRFYFLAGVLDIFDGVTDAFNV